MDRYEWLNEVGRGSFGVVSLVRRRDSPDSKLEVAKEVESFATNEVKVLRSLSHVNIVAYTDTFVADGRLYIVMEYVDGGDLSCAIRQRRSEGLRRFAQGEALSIISQCSSAVQYIHKRRILHRDLKSQNIFLTKDGVAKLGDFGIAKCLGEADSMASSVVGTPHYLPPEFCDGLPYGVSADIWSLGVVFYEVLALELPFEAPNLLALAVKILNAKPKPLPKDVYSDHVNQLVTWMLSKNPQGRPSTSDILLHMTTHHSVELASHPHSAGAASQRAPSRSRSARRGLKMKLPKMPSGAMARGRAALAEADSEEMLCGSRASSPTPDSMDESPRLLSVRSKRREPFPPTPCWREPLPPTPCSSSSAALLSCSSLSKLTVLSKLSSLSEPCNRGFSRKAGSSMMRVQSQPGLNRPAQSERQFPRRLPPLSASSRPLSDVVMRRCGSSFNIAGRAVLCKARTCE